MVPEMAAFERSFEGQGKLLTLEHLLVEERGVQKDRVQVLNMR